MEPRPLNTKIVYVYVFVNHLQECCPIMETKARITTSQMCPLNQLCAPVMTAVTVRLMDRALKPEMTPLYHFHAQKAPLGAFRNKNVTFGEKMTGFQGQK